MPNVYGEIPVGVINGVNTDFLLSNPPDPVPSLQYFLNGLLQRQGVDYTITGLTIHYMVTPPQTGDSHQAFYTFIASTPVVPSVGAGSFAELRGSDIVSMVQDRLGGYANALDTNVIMDVINEGKDEVWAILKNLNQNYFQASSQFLDSTRSNYFGTINSTQREYALPGDFRAIRFIECVTTGFQSVVLRRVPMSSPMFKEARRSSNELSNVNGVGTYYYDIAEADSGSTLEDGGIAAGGFEIVLAQWPETTLQLVLWYLRALPDMEMDTVLDQIIFPFSKKIANFATEKAMKILQDLQMSGAWLQTWRQDIVTIAQTGGAVDQADPQFVQDWGQ